MEAAVNAGVYATREWAIDSEKSAFEALFVLSEAFMSATIPLSRYPGYGGGSRLLTSAPGSELSMSRKLVFSDR